MKTSMYGYDQSVVTFLGNGLKQGDIVSISDNYTVEKAQAATLFCGVVLSSEEKYASVQTRGYIQVPYSGTLGLGFTNVVADGTGKICEDSSGRQALVVGLNNGITDIVL